jgi:EmrB/QacA subfamily drug resistance transporter
MTQEQIRYGVRLAILYAFVWFIDLLDASTLNVALPKIAEAFLVDPTNAEWTIVGFLLAMTIGMSISGWMGDRWSMRSIFLLGQALYIVSSLGCGLSFDLSSLIFFRIAQGFSGGLIIPLGMATLMRTMPESHWAKTASNMNMVTLLAPALGPLFAAYVTNSLGWRWLFFIKIPMSIVCFLLSLRWVKKTASHHAHKFDWTGFIYSAISLTLILFVFSEVGKPNFPVTLLIALFVLGALFAALFIYVEKKKKTPLVQLKIFSIRIFTYGNLIQIAANIIFLGSSFLIAFYLQNGINLGIVKTGWIMAAITPGMLLAMPFVGKFFNRLGPLPFMVPGLIVLGLSTIAFAFTDANTPPLLFAALIFLIGVSSSCAQTPNVICIFKPLPQELKGIGSSLYSLFKQISASMGVALSTMILSIGMSVRGIETITPSTSLALFKLPFVILGLIPLSALLLCSKMTKKHLQAKHLPSEVEMGAE